jgi:hypothetical protein
VLPIQALQTLVHPVYKADLAQCALALATVSHLARLDRLVTPHDVRGHSDHGSAFAWLSLPLLPGLRTRLNASVDDDSGAGALPASFTPGWLDATAGCAAVPKLSACAIVAGAVEPPSLRSSRCSQDAGAFAGSRSPLRWIAFTATFDRWLLAVAFSARFHRAR